MNLLSLLLLAADLYTVVSQPIERKVNLPGEFTPYQSVAIHARVTGFVEEVKVDVGSNVKKGDLLARLTAPEMLAQRLAAEARSSALESDRAEAAAKLTAAQSTHDRLTEASKTPGAIAKNELIQAAEAVEAARARVQSAGAAIRAARAQVRVLSELESYLNVTAPFDGRITTRLAHPGALVNGTGSTPMFQLEQHARLRLLVAVPEAFAASIPRGSRVAFTVAAIPGEHFHGVVARVPNSIDSKTRAMAVEMDVANPASRLAPGMYPTVEWPVKRARSLLVPPTAVVTTTERTFVIRVKDGRAEWVNVSRGVPLKDLLEVFGPLNAGDHILRRASDEIRDGSTVK